MGVVHMEAWFKTAEIWVTHERKTAEASPCCFFAGGLTQSWAVGGKAEGAWLGSLTLERGAGPTPKAGRRGDYGVLEGMGGRLPQAGGLMTVPGCSAQETRGAGCGATLW